MANKLEYHVRDDIENGRDFVLARIVATRGSSPRKEDSLSERTMVNPDKVHTYAVFGMNRKALRSELVDPERQAYVEIWKYDPKKLLQDDGYADPISIALSLEDTKDERIEAAVDEMLEQIWS